MTTKPFRYRALAFLRDRMNVHTTAAPESRIENEQGWARFDGALVEASASSTLNLAALWTLTSAAVVALVRERPMSAASHDALATAAFVGLVVGIALLVGAYVVRRRNTTRMRIELRLGDRVDADVIEGLHAHRQGRLAWIVAETGFTPEALATAARLDVRCLASDEDGHALAECTTEPATSIAKAA
jgi:hypothetical protein